jgi:hypothetical protein
MEQEHILNENELNEAYEQLRAVDDKITDLKKRKAEINQLINTSTIAKVKAKYPGIEFGDKVEVVCSDYDWRNTKATKTMVGFMGCFFLSRYYPEHDRDRESYVRLELYQVKKDGTKSLKKDEICILNILSIKKVEE